MKRITALIVSVLAAAACLTACGSSSSSAGEAVSASQTESSTAAVESTAESTADNTAESTAESKTESNAESLAESTSGKDADGSASGNSAGGSSSGWGPLAKAYTERLNGGVYSLDLSLSSSVNGEMSLKMDVNGDNAHAKTTLSNGIEIEAYLIDGKTYSLMPAMNSYTVTDGGSLDSQNVSLYSLSADARFVSSGEEDGLKTESYSVPLGSSSESALVEFANTVTFYFDDDGMAKKIVTEAPIMGKTTVVINSLVFEDVTVELPDLSGMTRLEQGADSEVDPKDAVKMTLSLMGITEDMVTKAGYTIEQLAEMELDEMSEVLAKIAKENGIE